MEPPSHLVVRVGGLLKLSGIRLQGQRGHSVIELGIM